MPSHILHCVAGAAALARHSGLAPTGAEEIRLFNLGCQGPDIFTHNRRTKPLSLAYARLLHRRGYGRFCAALARDVAGESDRALPYLLGFATHAAVDRVFHPYVVNRCFIDSSPVLSPALFHAFFERILDAEVLRARAGAPVSSFDADDAFPREGSIPARLVDGIARALRSAYPAETEGDVLIAERVANAFADSLSFYRVTNPARTTLAAPGAQGEIARHVGLVADGVALLHPEHLSPTIDWLNAAREPWRHPITGAAVHDSALDLVERAIDEAARAIETVSRSIGAGIPAGEVEAIVGDGSLSAVGPSGDQGPIRFAEPFPLESELLAQVAMRREWMAEIERRSPKGAWLTPEKPAGMIDA